MDRKILNVLVFALIAVFIACLPYLAEALTPYETQLGNNKGFLTGTNTLSISSGTATICPTLPDGAHEVWGISDNAFNFGDSTVSTATAELFVATLTPTLIADKIVSSNPTIYFRCRGADESATLTLRFK